MAAGSRIDRSTLGAFAFLIVMIAGVAALAMSSSGGGGVKLAPVPGSRAASEAFNTELTEVRWLLTEQAAAHGGHRPFADVVRSSLKMDVVSESVDNPAMHVVTTSRELDDKQRSVLRKALAAEVPGSSVEFAPSERAMFVLTIEGASPGLDLRLVSGEVKSALGDGFDLISASSSGERLIVSAAVGVDVPLAVARAEAALYQAHQMRRLAAEPTVRAARYRA